MAAWLYLGSSLSITFLPLVHASRGTPLKSLGEQTLTSSSSSSKSIRAPSITIEFLWGDLCCFLGCSSWWFRWLRWWGDAWFFLDADFYLLYCRSADLQIVLRYSLYMTYFWAQAYLSCSRASSESSWFELWERGPARMDPIWVSWVMYCRLRWADLNAEDWSSLHHSSIL